MSNENVQVLSVTTAELQQVLRCGKKSALRISAAANAEFRVGRRVLHHLPKIRAYLDAQTEKKGA